jgi:hypothetical protein
MASEVIASLTYKGCPKSGFPAATVTDVVKSAMDPTGTEEAANGVLTKSTKAPLTLSIVPRTSAPFEPW